MKRYTNMKRVLLGLLLFSSIPVYAVSSFTADSKVVSEFLKGDHNAWKTLRGPLDSINIVERNERPDGAVVYLIQVKTKQVDSSVKGQPADAPGCTGIFKLTATWNFTVLKKTAVEQINVACED